MKPFSSQSDPFDVWTQRVFALLWLEQWEQAETLLGQITSAARAAGTPTALLFPLALVSELEFRRGRIEAAHTAAADAVQLAAVTGETGALPYSLAALARVEAVLGRERDSLEHAAAALECCQRNGDGAAEAYALAALGLLELTRGRAQPAAEHLSECARVERDLGVGLPSITQAAGDLVEAHVRRGERAQAEQALAVLEARDWSLRWPRAVAARCRGLLVDDFEAEFEIALALFGSEMAFERARTQLCLGMRRRRGGGRSHARSPLREALRYFERAGARPWAQQARAEFDATGESRAPSHRDTLTPQELQVATVVADGASNREAAGSLFLSEKTIEFHLTNTYRKLGVRSRTQLVRRLAAA